MGVIVVVCAAFGVTILEDKTEIMCLRTKGMPAFTAIFKVEVAGQVCKRTNSYTSRGTLTITPTCLLRSTGAYSTTDTASESTPSNCTTN